MYVCMYVLPLPNPPPPPPPRRKILFYYDAPLAEEYNMSTAIHRVFDIRQNVRIIFETSDNRLLKALCDVKTEGK